MRYNKTLLFGCLLLATLLVAGCSTPEQDFEDNTIPETGEEQVPVETINDVLATVNGEEITNEDVSAVQQSVAQQGQQLSDEDALEQVINQVVLSQQVQQSGITVTTEEAEAAVEEQLSQQGATLEDYKQQLESQGGSYQEVLESFKNDIAVQRYLESALQEQEFEVTDEEITEFYEMYEQQSQEEVPPKEELEPQIVATLQQQKQQETVNALIQELRSNADIVYN